MDDLLGSVLKLARQGPWGCVQQPHAYSADAQAITNTESEVHGERACFLQNLVVGDLSLP